MKHSFFTDKPLVKVCSREEVSLLERRPHVICPLRDCTEDTPHHSFINGVGGLVREDAGRETRDTANDAKLSTALQNAVTHQKIGSLSHTIEDSETHRHTDIPHYTRTTP